MMAIIPKIAKDNVQQGNPKIRFRLIGGRPGVPRSTPLNVSSSARIGAIEHRLVCKSILDYMAYCGTHAGLFLVHC